MIFLPDETEKTDKVEQEPEDETDETDGFTNPKQPTKQAEYTAKIKHTAQKSKQESIPSFLSAFGIFLIRPRLTIFLAVNYFLFFFTTTICPIIKINVTPKPLLRKSRFSKYSIKIPIKLATNATMIILAYGWFFVYFFQFLYKKTHSSILFRL